MNKGQNLSRALRHITFLLWFLIFTVIGCTFLNLMGSEWFKNEVVAEQKQNILASVTPETTEEKIGEIRKSDNFWQAPDTLTIPENEEGELIKYGRELVIHTSVYLGPKGKVLQMSNGMNCQNCHLDAGTKSYANNFAAVRSSYPKFRKRSGISEDYVYRVNGCFQRSMNGKKLDPESKEMKAFIAYLKWVGKDVEKGDEVVGKGTPDLPLLDRPADPEKGRLVYVKYCQVCHGKNGEGTMKPNGLEYIYPPLYGENSFNIGAGMYRLTQFAEYVKSNMPFGVSYFNPILSDEEAWDVAAYVNSQPRPQKDLSDDWHNIADKPYDHPFGPYADGFSETQHKYGPFQEIIESKIQ